MASKPSDRPRPSVPPPVAKQTGSPDDVADGAMPVGAPMYRQYLDRTTTTSVITLGYRPTRALVRRVYWVGISMALVAMVAAIPALTFLPFREAPTWARLILLASAVQIAYVGWMMLVPDWSTVRTTMFVFVGIAAAYGFAMATAIATPPGAPVTFEMGPVRSEAIRWCALVMGLIAITTFFSGRLAHRWRKGYVEANHE